jgi:hypothetical protein
MSYVPRSPRRSTSLRAVVDDGASHAVGPVRDMSTSGLFVEARTPLRVGHKVAVVPLIGDLDGERLPAEVARVGERGVALRFLGLDVERRQSLRSIFGGESAHKRRLRGPLPRTQLPPIPRDAPVVLLTDEPAPIPAPVELREDVLELHAALEQLEGQLLELGRKNGVLLDENSRLKRESMALQARLSIKAHLEDELLEAQEMLLELEQAQDALVREIQRLEAIVRRR